MSLYSTPTFQKPVAVAAPVGPRLNLAPLAGAAFLALGIAPLLTWAEHALRIGFRWRYYASDGFGALFLRLAADLLFCLFFAWLMLAARNRKSRAALGAGLAFVAVGLLQSILFPFAFQWLYKFHPMWMERVFHSAREGWMHWVFLAAGDKGCLLTPVTYPLGWLPSIGFSFFRITAVLGLVQRLASAAFLAWALWSLAPSRWSTAAAE